MWWYIDERKKWSWKILWRVIYINGWRKKKCIWELLAGWQCECGSECELRAKEKQLIWWALCVILIRVSNLTLHWVWRFYMKKKIHRAERERERQCMHDKKAHNNALHVVLYHCIVIQTVHSRMWRKQNIIRHIQFYWYKLFIYLLRCSQTTCNQFDLWYKVTLSSFSVFFFFSISSTNICFLITFLSRLIGW